MTALEPSLPSAGLIAISGAWALFLDRRIRSAQLRREESVREAVSLLARHVVGLEALDDPEVPHSLRELALEISDLLHDADQGPYVVEAARLRAQDRPRRPKVALAAESPSGVSQRSIATLRADVLGLRARRPDLSEAFGRCIVAAILSFKRRHPECAAALDLNAAQVVASPAAEAERVIRRARDAVTKMALKPAGPIVMQP